MMGALSGEPTSADQSGGNSRGHTRERGVDLVCRQGRSAGIDRGQSTSAQLQ